MTSRRSRSLVGQVYEGPLDLLLDLIRKQDIDIYDIPIAKITAQYLKYVETHEAVRRRCGGRVHLHGVAADPHQVEDAAAARSRRACGGRKIRALELVNRLLEHERFKTAAQMLMQKQQIEEAVWSNPALKEFRDAEGTEPEMAADVVDLVKTFQQILDRARSRPIFDVDGRKRHGFADD